MSWTVAALYRFIELSDLPTIQAQVKDVCAWHGIVGTILLAPEAINGTIAGENGKLADVIDFLDARFGIRSGELKYSSSEDRPFLKLKIRLKKEIITMRAPEANPAKAKGAYVAPEDWNALISDPDVLLLDTRNTYETAVGIFKGAVDPKIATFTAFKDFVKTLDPAKHKKVAMFCTGGIRCEKASSYMLAQGFEDVYHLKGGILKYLEVVSTDDSLWQGDCYVFDRRVAVGHGLAESDWAFCFGCGHPLAAEDRAHKAYEEGVSCARCIDSLDEQRAASLRMRHLHVTQTGKRAT
jgi:UPF0176 protein